MMKYILFFFQLFFGIVFSLEAQDLNKKLPIDGGKIFLCEGKTAFLIMPNDIKDNRDIPWVFYAPTLKNLPKDEGWMFKRLLDNGIAIAGIDVGESYGNDEGRRIFSELYKELVSKYNLNKKVCLLARSRGGLQLYNWAVDNPEKVCCIAGIYPVVNILSYPGLAKASKAYNMGEEEFLKVLNQNNPIDRVDNLVKYHIPIFHIHGDIDKLVPLSQNSVILKERLESKGGDMNLKIIEGHGHSLWEGWFKDNDLINFIIDNALKL